MALYLGLTASGDPYDKFKELYSRKSYFELRDALKKYAGDQAAEFLFYKGVVANKFNRLQSSIGHLQHYLKQVKPGNETALLIDCYEILADNYVKTAQYRQAAEIYRTILATFGQQIDKEKAADYKNSVKLWGALKDVAPQTAVFTGDSFIPIPEDKKGYIPLQINEQRLYFGVDTGANLSLIKRSLANKLAFKIFDTTIAVGTITGQKISANAAIAPAIKLGKVTVKNVIFLVFDDSFLSAIHPELNGLIGFPFMAALKETTFSQKGISIPARASACREQNMCLDGLMPLVVALYKGKRLIFAFDTGATGTDLYPPFYKAFENEIKGDSSQQVGKVVGVGTSRQVTFYRLKSMTIEVSGKKAHLKGIKVLTEPTNKESHCFYGNLGQDLVRQFDTFTLNFESMCISFE